MPDKVLDAVKDYRDKNKWKNADMYDNIIKAELDEIVAGLRRLGFSRRVVKATKDRKGEPPGNQEP